ncbi:nuclear transport factor 2 family protein [Streptomyces sp. NPDC047706]|uniref:nuclear transport factor 2 family protein n=1 Tax=Streptomyces sp. NPDC047706 TaxID=3365486 RepID=UPI00371A7CF6
MTTPLDHYFDALNRADSDGSSMGHVFEMLAENVLIMHCGEFVQGKERAVAFLQRKARKSGSGTYSCWASVGDRGAIAGQWREERLDLRDGRSFACGQVVTILDIYGRISYLNLSLTSASNRARLLAAKHMQVWTIPDPCARGVAMEGIYAHDITFMEPEPDRVLQGREELNHYIDAAQNRTPLSGMEVGDCYQNENTVLFQWTAILPDDSTATGWEVLYTSGDLIERVVVFSPDHELVAGATRVN